MRELENYVERSAILGKPAALESAEPHSAPPSPGPAKSAAAPAAANTLEDVERGHILRVLEQTRWAIEGERGAARILGLNPSTLRERLRKLGIRKSS